MNWLESKYNVPFSIIKKIIYIRDSDYDYHIDEDGYGFAIIDNQKIVFFVNEYSEIVTDTIRFD